MSELLVVAGEASGDALAAPVVERLGAPSFGLGGHALRSAGCEVLSDVPAVSAMGLAAVRRGPTVLAAVAAMAMAVRRRRPRAALLVGFSELNTHLAPWLRGRGVRVVWYAPPQVWAWRKRRARAIADACDRLAVVLPFELSVWQRAGARVDYVGHPALNRDFRPAAEPSNGIDTVRLALLPGSRAHEVRAHAQTLLEAARRIVPVVSEGTVRVVRARSLDGATADWLGRTTRAAGAAVVDAPFDAALSGQHLALVGSGTATLECAALGVPPVVVYRTDFPTYALARLLVAVPHIGLPNLVLGERAFPELVQGAATSARIAAAALAVLSRRQQALARCAAARAALQKGLDGQTPADRVAGMVSEWLA